MATVQEVDKELSKLDVSSSEDKVLYKLPGEYDYDGMVFQQAVNRESLRRLRDEVDFTKDDVISTGLPKTGSTWINAILYKLMYGDKSEDEETIKKSKLSFIELDFPNSPPSLDKVLDLEPPRLIRSHLPLRYFSRNIRDGGPKIVCVMRNPKDMLVSTYHFYKMNKALGQFKGSWDEFFELFKSKRIYYEDYVKYYSAWTKNASHPNVLLVKYESMIKDPLPGIRRIARFLGKNLTDTELSVILDETSFDNMSKDKVFNDLTKQTFDQSVSKFFRKGKVGDWQNYFSKEQNEYMDRIYSEQLVPQGIQIDFTL